MVQGGVQGRSANCLELRDRLHLSRVLKDGQKSSRLGGVGGGKEVSQEAGTACKRHRNVCHKVIYLRTTGK